MLALERGQQQLIFRKGGIAEEGRGFAVDHDRFWLFPTYFHQQKVGLGEAYSSLYEEAMRRKPSEGRVAITSWVQVRRSFIVESEKDLELLAAQHVYAPHILTERLHGRHGAALFALEVDVHLLERPFDLPLLERYGGCRSWVDLELPPV